MSTTWEAVQTNAHKLLVVDRHDVTALLPVLRSALDAQCKEQGYDYELNAALLKLYLLRGSLVKAEFPQVISDVSRILLKALMQQPEPDFSLSMMLLSESTQAAEQITAIASLAEKLQTSRFGEFWDAVKANNDLIAKVPGFDKAVRRYVVRVVGGAYREISNELLAKYLGLASVKDLSSAPGVSDSGLVLDLTTKEGLVVFPTNAENHPRAASAGDKASPSTGAATASGSAAAAVVAASELSKVETLAGYVVTLEKSEGASFLVNPNHKEVSKSAQRAVERMRQQIAVGSTSSSAF